MLAELGTLEALIIGKKKIQIGITEQVSVTSQNKIVSDLSVLGNCHCKNCKAPWGRRGRAGLLPDLIALPQLAQHSKKERVHRTA